MQILDPSDENSQSLWQCFLKVLAKNPGLDDRVRMDSMMLLIDHCTVVVKLPHLFNFSKWIQFIKALLKMNKYSLKRSSLNYDCLKSIVELVSCIPQEAIVLELLSLPVRVDVGIDLSEVKKVYKGISLPCFPVDLQPDTVGGLLKSHSSPTELCSDLLKGDLIGRTCAKRWSVKPPDCSLKCGELGFWLDVIFTAWNPPSQLRQLRSLDHLISLYISTIFEEEATIFTPLLKATLYKILTKVAIDLETISVTERLVYISLMNRKSLKMV